ncbi:uncharacterized protein LOC142566620 [Dermacentor variabilis]|uniref:uncharacterized protein LOC142566620 n=1 Tax=Dermacentor variabilis TaxID=34621 RepID=UPI003F5C7493
MTFIIILPRLALALSVLDTMFIRGMSLTPLFTLSSWSPSLLLVCFQKCLIEVEMQKCGCAFYTRELSPSFTTKICSLTQMNDCIAETKDSGHYDHCETACDLACKETEYDARLAGFSKYQGLNETTGKFGLHLSFATSAVEVFLYEPAMKEMQLSA